AALKEGVETHQIDGVSINIYCPEKTLADCFKFRNKLGMDIVLEALKFYKARKTFNLEKLIMYARGCRVEKIMRPYLEATLWQNFRIDILHSRRLPVRVAYKEVRHEHD